MSGASFRHYSELGLPSGASALDVRRAFFRVARKCHPDKCDAPGSLERFRRARLAFEALVGPGPGPGASKPDLATNIDSDDSDGWEPPPPPSAKAKPPLQAGFAEGEPEPTRDLSDLVKMVRASVDELLDGAIFRRRFLQACIMWPWACTRTEFRRELLKLLRDELDRRIVAEDWPRLSKKDLAWWLEARGCHLYYAVEDDAIGSDVFIRLVCERTRLGGATDTSTTPLPSLTVCKEKTRADEPQACTAKGEITRLPLKPEGLDARKKASPGKRGKSLSTSSKDVLLKSKNQAPSSSAGPVTATQTDYVKWLQQAFQRGNWQQGVDYLMRMASSGKLFKGRRLEAKVLRAAVSELGLDVRLP